MDHHIAHTRYPSGAFANCCAGQFIPNTCSLLASTDLALHLFAIEGHDDDQYFVRVCQLPVLGEVAALATISTSGQDRAAVLLANGSLHVVEYSPYRLQVLSSLQALPEAAGDPALHLTVDARHDPPLAVVASRARLRCVDLPWDGNPHARQLYNVPTPSWVSGTAGSFITDLSHISLTGVVQDMQAWVTAKNVHCSVRMLFDLKTGACQVLGGVRLDPPGVGPAISIPGLPYGLMRGEVRGWDMLPDYEHQPDTWYSYRLAGRVAPSLRGFDACVSIWLAPVHCGDGTQVSLARPLPSMVVATAEGGIYVVDLDVLRPSSEGGAREDHSTFYGGRLVLHNFETHGIIEVHPCITLTEGVIAMDALPGRRVVCVTALHQVLLLRLEPAAAGALPVCVQVCRLPRVPPLVNCVLANLEPRIADPTVAAAQSQAQLYGISQQYDEGDQPPTGAQGTLCTLWPHPRPETVVETHLDATGGAITSMWALKAHQDQAHHALAVLSFTNGTKVLAIQGGVFSDVTERLPLDSSAQTLAAGNLGVGDWVAQVTAHGVAAFRLSPSFAARDGALWTPPPSTSITLAAVSAGLVIVQCSTRQGGRAVAVLRLTLSAGKGLGGSQAAELEVLGELDSSEASCISQVLSDGRIARFAVGTYVPSLLLVEVKLQPGGGSTSAGPSVSLFAEVMLRRDAPSSPHKGYIPFERPNTRPSPLAAARAGRLVAFPELPESVLLAAWHQVPEEEEPNVQHLLDYEKLPVPISGQVCVLEVPTTGMDPFVVEVLLALRTGEVKLVQVHGRPVAPGAPLPPPPLHPSSVPRSVRVGTLPVSLVFLPSTGATVMEPLAAALSDRAALIVPPACHGDAMLVQPLDLPGIMRAVSLLLPPPENGAVPSTSEISGAGLTGRPRQPTLLRYLLCFTHDGRLKLTCLDRRHLCPFRCVPLNLRPTALAAKEWLPGVVAVAGRQGQLRPGIPGSREQPLVQLVDPATGAVLAQTRPGALKPLERVTQLLMLDSFPEEGDVSAASGPGTSGSGGASGLRCRLVAGTEMAVAGGAGGSHDAAPVEISVRCVEKLPSPVTAMCLTRPRGLAGVLRLMVGVGWRLVSYRFLHNYTALHVEACIPTNHCLTAVEDAPSRTTSVVTCDGREGLTLRWHSSASPGQGEVVLVDCADKVARHAVSAAPIGGACPLFAVLDKGGGVELLARTISQPERLLEHHSRFNTGCPGLRLVQGSMMRHLDDGGEVVPLPAVLVVGAVGGVVVELRELPINSRCYGYWDSEVFLLQLRIACHPELRVLGCNDITELHDFRTRSNPQDVFEHPPPGEAPVRGRPVDAPTQQPQQAAEGVPVAVLAEGEGGPPPEPAAAPLPLEQEDAAVPMEEEVDALEGGAVPQALVAPAAAAAAEPEADPPLSAEMLESLATERWQSQLPYPSDPDEDEPGLVLDGDLLRRFLEAPAWVQQEVMECWAPGEARTLWCDDVAASAARHIADLILF